MNTGKQKCETLKTIRKQIAEQYGLCYNPTECTHEGNCSGTCPKCDAELQDLQRQLESRGIRNVDLLNVSIETSEDNEIHILEGDVSAPNKDDLVTVTMGMPLPPLTYKEKRRVLYKECQIAGITYHDLKETWDELYEGAELVLVRDKENEYDKNAIAVALADDYDIQAPEDFDFNYILGYVPRAENEYLAMMMDLGWAEAFECELSRIEGNNPYKGKLYMSIFIVSKDEVEVDDTNDLIRIVELDKDEYDGFMLDLNTKGCTYFRSGRYLPWKSNFPEKGETIIFMHRREDKTTLLYIMYCIAVGDDDASYFVEEKDTLFAVDDSCYYVFTNSRGPIRVQSKKLDFLSSEKINKKNILEELLSREASFKLKSLIGL